MQVRADVSIKFSDCFVKSSVCALSVIERSVVTLVAFAEPVYSSDGRDDGLSLGVEGG